MAAKWFVSPASNLRHVDFSLFGHRNLYLPLSRCSLSKRNCFATCRQNVPVVYEHIEAAYRVFNIAVQCIHNSFYVVCTRQRVWDKHGMEEKKKHKLAKNARKVMNKEERKKLLLYLKKSNRADPEDKDIFINLNVCHRTILFGVGICSSTPARRSHHTTIPEIRYARNDWCACHQWCCWRTCAFAPLPKASPHSSFLFYDAV